MLIKAPRKLIAPQHHSLKRPQREVSSSFPRITVGREIHYIPIRTDACIFANFAWSMVNEDLRNGRCPCNGDVEPSLGKRKYQQLAGDSFEL